MLVWTNFYNISIKLSLSNINRFWVIIGRLCKHKDFIKCNKCKQVEKLLESCLSIGLPLLTPYQAVPILPTPEGWWPKTPPQPAFGHTLNLVCACGVLVTNDWRILWELTVSHYAGLDPVYRKQFLSLGGSKPVSPMSVLGPRLFCIDTTSLGTTIN